VPQPRTSRSAQAYRYLLDELLRGRWQPGETLSAYALAEELGISRTPVLEALKRLESEGLVEIIPQVGCRVVAPSPESRSEAFSLRTALEGVAAEAAARRIGEDQLAGLELLLRRLDESAARGDPAAYAELNRRFHDAVNDAADMPRLSEAARSAWAPLRYGSATHDVTDRQLRESAAEHRDLFEALRRRAPRRARAAAERHVTLAARRSRPADAARSPALVHRALIYDGEEEFLAATIPFISDGLAARERVLVVTTPQNAGVLGHALGARAPEVEFRDSDEWYQLPSHTLLSYERYIEEADRDRVRVVGEVSWQGETQAPMAEWKRYESIINLAFAEQPVSFVCPYDVRRLPEAIIDDAARTHPELCKGAHAEPSSSYVEPVPLIRELDREGLPEPDVPTSERPITADLREVREFILDETRRAGVRGKTIQDTFLAVQEVASNVVDHGAGEGSIRTWVQADELVFEVRDDGTALTDPVMGQLLSSPSLMTEPRGLWMARLLCDLVEVRVREQGLIVRLHVAL
jgi:DNA-binding GntR family transcriptional regulator/anti-sigma regulatory factor (Ser/Thr protein kinase)